MFLKILKKTYQIIKKTYVIAIVFFVANFLIKNHAMLSRIKFDIFFFDALLVNILSILLLAVPFYYLVKGFNKEVSFFEMFKLHVDSWPTKYLPIKIAPQIMKINHARENNYNIINFSIPVIFDIVYLLLVMLFIVLISSAMYLPDWRVYIIIFTGICALSACALPKILNFSEKKFPVLKNLKLPEVKQSFKKTNYLQLFAVYIIYHLLAALPMPFLANSFVPLGIQGYAHLTYINLIGMFFGMIAVFAPYGIGVREAIQTSALLRYFDLKTSIMISLMARLIAILADLCIFLLSITMKHLSIGRKGYNE